MLFWVEIDQNYDNMQTKAEKEEHLSMIENGQLDIKTMKSMIIGIRNDEGKWAANGAGFAELRESMMECETNYDN